MSAYRNTGLLVQGNFIGTTADGTSALGNTYNGVIDDQGTSNMIGGTVGLAGNVIAFNGVSNGSSNQPLLRPIVGPNRRDGALDPNMAGPLGTTLSLRLADPTTGIVLNSWVDADRVPKGGAPAIIGP